MAISRHIDFDAVFREIAAQAEVFCILPEFLK